MADLHVPKLETFDIAASANVDPKGYVRDVDVFEVHPHGLYMARGADHPQFGHLESWLLPSLGLRANIFHFRPGVEATSRRYLDVAEVTHDESGVWRTRDLYLDLLVLDGAARVGHRPRLRRPGRHHRPRRRRRRVAGRGRLPGDLGGRRHSRSSGSAAPEAGGHRRGPRRRGGVNPGCGAGPRAR